MRATIDGVAWASDAAFVTPGAQNPTAGSYYLSGTKTNDRNVFLSLASIPGPGTYPLGVTPPVAGGTAGAGNASPLATWGTEQSGVAGTVTITTLTSTQIGGTFSFNGTPTGGAATGTKRVTDGSFLFEVKGSAGPSTVPGSKLSATVDGTFWNAAIVSASMLNAGGITTLAISTGGSVGGLTVTLPAFSGTGTYMLTSQSPVRSVAFSSAAGAVWTTYVGMPCTPPPTCPSNGVVTITSFGSGRVAGTFSGTLGPQIGTPATGFRTITNGSFDLAIQ